MAGVPVHHLQLTQAGDTLFAQDLIELLQLVRRPVAEFWAYEISGRKDVEARLVVRCALRGSEVTPRSDTIAFVLYARTWEEGLRRACQEAIARIVRFHQYELRSTRFRHYGMRDGEGDPTPGIPHPIMGDHLIAMEKHLALTEAQLDEARFKHDYNLQTGGHAHIDPIDLESRDWIIEELQGQVVRLEGSNEMLRKRTRSLKRKCADLEDEIAALDDGEDIRKEDDAYLSVDEDHDEEEDVSNSEDRAFIDDEEESDA
jgi:hypothetical protein